MRLFPFRGREEKRVNASVTQVRAVALNIVRWSVHVSLQTDSPSKKLRVTMEGCV